MRLRILFFLKREITNWFPLQIATDDNLNSSSSIHLLYPDCLLCLKIITLLYKNIFYKNIEAKIYEILRINPRLRFWKGYSFSWKSVNTIQFSTTMWMLGALWLVVAHDLSEYRYMDDVTRNLFSLFCSTWRAVLKMFVGLFRIKASEILEKSSTRGNYNRKKNEEKGTKKKKLLTTLECLNYEKSSQQLPSCFIAMRDSPFCKCFRHYSALSKKRRWKTFRRNCIQLRERKKEEAETKSSAWDLNNAK